jgi:hypothetical protein
VNWWWTVNARVNVTQFNNGFKKALVLVLVGYSRSKI